MQMSAHVPERLDRSRVDRVARGGGALAAAVASPYTAGAISDSTISGVERLFVKLKELSILV